MVREKERERERVSVSSSSPGESERALGLWSSFLLTNQTRHGLRDLADLIICQHHPADARGEERGLGLHRA